MIADLVLLFVFIILVLVWLKLNFFVFYVWQNYEYRRDRIKAYLRSSRFYYDFIDLINPFEIFLVRRPRLTIKVIMLFFLTFYGEIVIFFRFLKPLAVFLHITHYLLLAVVLDFVLVILVTPLLSFLTVFLISIPSILVKKLIIRQAKTKIKSYPNLITIGITGSYGKTSTKLILSWLLQTKYKVLTTAGSVNTDIGIAKTVLRQLDSSTEVFIVEMGAYKIGEIKKICDLVYPRIALITGINSQHIELFGSLENILQAKYELVESLPPDGLAIINVGNSFSRRLYLKTKTAKIGYTSPVKKIATNLKPDFLQENIQAALIIARHLKISQKTLNKALQKIPFSRYITQIKKGVNRTHIIDNSYNTNPSGFEESLRFLKTVAKKKALVVTPGIIELGEEGYKVHQNIARQLAGVAHTLVLTNRNFYRVFAKELPKNVKLVVAKPKMNFQTLVKPGSWILLEGRIPAWLYRHIVKN